MRSKYFLVFVFIFLLFPLYYAQDSIAYKTESELNNMPGENFLPLAKGNKWQVINYNYAPNSLCRYEVIDTCTINNKLYYKIDEDHRIYYLRYDTVNNKVYRTYSITPVNEYLLFDFNLAQDTQFLQGDTVATAINSGFQRGYRFQDGKSLVVSKNIGFYTFTEPYFGIPETYFLDALIKGGNTKYYVRINLPDPSLKSWSFPAIIEKNQWYLKFSFSPDAKTFILNDTLKMHGYYKKLNDSIPAGDFILNRVYDRIDTTLTLDSALLTKNYNFYCRLEYTDKCLIPRHFFYPQTGYSCLSSLMDVKNENLEKMNYSLRQNYPNPFNPSTNIQYYVPSECRVNVTIYNALGAKVKELVNGTESQGNYEVKFDGTGLASGIYFVTLKAASVDGKQSFTGSKKMILMK